MDIKPPAKIRRTGSLASAKKSNDADQDKPPMENEDAARDVVKRAAPKRAMNGVKKRNRPRTGSDISRKPSPKTGVDLNKPADVFSREEVSAATDLVEKEIEKESTTEEQQEEYLASAPILPPIRVKRKPKNIPEHNPHARSKPVIEGQKKVRPLGLYKKIAFAFSFFTIVLLAAVLYFAFVKVDIILIPNQERVSNNLIFDVYDKDKNQEVKQGAISGAVKSAQIEESKKYSASGSKTAGQDLSGKIIIVNSYNKNQTLVATTRLLSADNKLFRIKDTVSVPAGGSAEVEVYADKISPEMSVDGPTKWTIPGLWAGLQDKIYGENKEPLKYRQIIKSIVSPADLEQAVKDMKDLLLSKASTQLSDSYKDYDKVIYSIDEKSLVTDIDAKAGDEKSEFTVKMKANVAVVAFKEDAVVKLASDKINSTIPDNKELSDFDKSKLTYNLNTANTDSGIATVNSTFEGRITLKPDVTIVDKEKIVGLTKTQLNLYLANIPELAGSEVKFFPSFITKVPDLVDRINIEIKK